MTSVDIDAVGEILREAAMTAIVQRFRSLADHEIEEKSPGEVVTVADRDAERFITARLHEILPGVPVVGEEAAATNPDLLDTIDVEPWVWLVDPFDGTANFARGDPHWAVMVALLRNGETVASWIYRHTDDRLYLAELGGVTWRGGARLRCSTDKTAVGSLRGTVLKRFLTGEERRRMVPHFDDFQSVGGGVYCAGYEYPAIIDDEQHFALFQRLLPWDHAPGVLLLTEAGGVARHPDAGAFRPGQHTRGLLLASSAAVWASVQRVLYENVTVESSR